MDSNPYSLLSKTFLFSLFLSLIESCFRSDIALCSIQVESRITKVKYLQQLKRCSLIPWRQQLYLSAATIKKGWEGNLPASFFRILPLASRLSLQLIGQRISSCQKVRRTDSCYPIYERGRSAEQGSQMLLASSLLAWPIQKKTAYSIIFRNNVVIAGI